MRSPRAPRPAPRDHADASARPGAGPASTGRRTAAPACREPRPDRGVHLVPVAEPVHQPGVARLGGGVRAAVQQRPQPVRVGRPPGRDQPQRVGVDRAGQLPPATRGAPGSARCAGSGRRRSCTRAAARTAARPPACPAPRAGMSSPRPRPAARPPAGLQPDLAEGRGQRVRGEVCPGPVEALGPRHGRLAAAGERLDPEPELLHRGPGQHAADLADQPDHPRVLARLVQRPQRRPELSPAPGAQPVERVVRAPAVTGTSVRSSSSRTGVRAGSADTSPG